MPFTEYMRKGKDSVSGFFERKNVPRTAAAAGYVLGMGLVINPFFHLADRPETPVLDAHRVQIDEARTALDRYAGNVQGYKETIIQLPHHTAREMQDSLDTLTKNLLAAGTASWEGAHAMREERAMLAAYEQASEKKAKYFYTGLGLIAVSSLGMLAAARREEEYTND